MDLSNQMMDRTFLFYDLETSGLNKSFDQVLQFAAIRTDLNLNTIKEYEYLVKLSPDTLIDPMALLVHELTPQKCSTGLDELTAITKIHSLINQPGTISLGYNTLGFDDEFLRFAFYKHLLPPYTHQFANNCSRADLYPLLVLYKLFKPEIINWPKKNHKISLRLEDLNDENKLHQGKSHDAMNDVRATIELAKKMITQPNIWQFSLAYFDKSTDQQRTEKALKNSKYAIMISALFGSQHNFNHAVLYLGRHKTYKNQTIWLKITKESINIINNNSAKDLNQLIIRKKDGEANFILPFNKGEKIWSTNWQEQVEQVIAWCAKNSPAIENIANYHTSYIYPKITDCDIGASLYQIAFPNYKTMLQHQDFCQASWEEKVFLLNSLPKNSKILAERLIWRHKPGLLKTQSDNLTTHISKLQNSISLLDHKNQLFRNKQDVLAAIDDLTPNVNQQELLKQYKAWLKTNYGVAQNNIASN